MSARQWLLENGYEDIAAMVSEAMATWKAKGYRTRRNWWEVLAGTPRGQLRTVYGVAFPVLAVARRQQGLSEIEGALQRQPDEEPPPKTPHGRSLTRARERGAGES